LACGGCGTSGTAEEAGRKAVPGFGSRTQQRQCPTPDTGEKYRLRGSAS
jgi:hypothetical protein